MPSMRITSHRVGSLVGTIVSATFLLAIAAMNVAILVQVWRAFQRVKNDQTYTDDSLDTLLCGGGFLSRILRPMFAMIRSSWHMYPLGFLFGLGFDTATEIGLLGISGAAASKGMSIWSIMVFPTLFTAGMTLLDTTDGILMLGAYGWAFVRPVRKLYYNLTITAVSVLVAVLVGGIEVLGLIADRFNLDSGFWSAIGTLNSNFGIVGFGIIGIFIASWLVAAVIYRWKGYDKLDAELATVSIHSPPIN
jgi:high-affinity nickel-transport protein